MRVLVTNDDGVDAVGIQRLAIALAGDDRFDVIVVAPDGDRSGAGASLGVLGPDGLNARRVNLPDDGAIEAWALDGPPAMCVLAARLGGFGDPPGIVVSGINAGMNTGRAILHSGTVGAALTAQNFGMSGLSVSLQEGDPWQWDTAAELTVEVMQVLLEAPPRSVLNLNVPNVPRSSVKDIRWARLAPFGEVRMALLAHDGDPDSSGAPTRHLSRELKLTEVSFDADTDTGLVRAGYASLTTVVGVVEAWPDETQIGPPAIHERLTPGAPLQPAHQVPDPDGNAWLRRPAIAT